jgi:hypothetical protein
MAHRKNPTVQVGSMMDHQDAHESKLSEMHDALYSLGDKIRKPYPRNGEKLLPKDLRAEEKPEAAAARKHIDALHKAMKREK